MCERTSAGSSRRWQDSLYWLHVLISLDLLGLLDLFAIFESLTALNLRALLQTMDVDSVLLTKGAIPLVASLALRLEPAVGSIVLVV